MSQPAANSGMNASGSTLQGLFRQKYSKEVKALIPNFAIIQKRVPFAQAEMLGDFYHLPVVLTDEHGFTYGGSTAQNYSLNASIAMQLQDAQVTGYELTLTSEVSYGAVSRSMKRGETAVERLVDLLIERMKASSAKRLEIAMLYGQSATGIGQISAHSGSGGTRTYTISTATFAPGIWAGLENAQLDCLETGSTSTGPLNTNAAVVVTSVNVGASQISVSGNSTDLTAIDSAISTGANFFFYGAAGQLTSSNVSNEMAGIDVILLNTGSLFNINATTYNLWQANTYSCGSAELSMGKVLSGLSLAVSRGLLQDVQLLVNPQTWSNLNSDLAGMRYFDESYDPKKAENGVNSIVYHFQGGKVEIISHPFVKQGEAFAIVLDEIQRVGSADMQFRGQGPEDQIEYLFQNTSTNGWTARMYSDTAIMIEAPAHCVKFTNITNT